MAMNRKAQNAKTMSKESYAKLLDDVMPRKMTASGTKEPFEISFHFAAENVLPIAQFTNFLYTGPGGVTIPLRYKRLKLKKITSKLIMLDNALKLTTQLGHRFQMEIFGAPPIVYDKAQFDITSNTAGFQKENYLITPGSPLFIEYWFAGQSLGSASIIQEVPPMVFGPGGNGTEGLTIIIIPEQQQPVTATQFINHQCDLIFDVLEY